MSHTIDDLLVLSRTGEREEPGEEVDLAEAVARRAPPLGAHGRRARDRAGGRARRRPARVWASRADLDRAVDAVLENAIALHARAAAT